MSPTRTCTLLHVMVGLHIHDASSNPNETSCSSRAVICRPRPSQHRLQIHFSRRPFSPASFPLVHNSKGAAANKDPLRIVNLSLGILGSVGFQGISFFRTCSG